MLHTGNHTSPILFVWVTDMLQVWACSFLDNICACTCPLACLQTYIQDLANQKAMGIIQVPTAGKFLGLLVTSPPGTPQPKLLALVLNLPQQQTQRPSPVQR